MNKDRRKYDRCWLSQVFKYVGSCPHYTPHCTPPQKSAATWNKSPSKLMLWLAWLFISCAGTLAIYAHTHKISLNSLLCTAECRVSKGCKGGVTCARTPAMCIQIDPQSASRELARAHNPPPCDRPTPVGAFNNLCGDKCREMHTILTICSAPLAAAACL